MAELPLHGVLSGRGCLQLPSSHWNVHCRFVMDEWEFCGFVILFVGKGEREGWGVGGDSKLFSGAGQFASCSTSQESTNASRAINCCLYNNHSLVWPYALLGPSLTTDFSDTHRHPGTHTHTHTHTHTRTYIHTHTRTRTHTHTHTHTHTQ